MKPGKRDDEVGGRGRTLLIYRREYGKFRSDSLVHNNRRLFLFNDEGGRLRWREPLSRQGG